MKKQAMSMPPKAVVPNVNLDNPELLNMLNAGGSVATQQKNWETVKTIKEDENPLKNFSIKLFESELKEIRAHLLGIGGRKSKSIQTFILEAISEKLKRETK